MPGSLTAGRPARTSISFATNSSNTPKSSPTVSWNHCSAATHVLKNLDEAAVALWRDEITRGQRDFVEPEPRAAHLKIPSSRMIRKPPSRKSKSETGRLGCQIRARFPKHRSQSGRRRYWASLAAAQANNLSMRLHVGGTQTSAPSAGGWPQFYIEDHHVLVQLHAESGTRWVWCLEGVFDAFPRLKVALVEGGFRLGPRATRRGASTRTGRRGCGGPEPETQAIRIHEDESLVRRPTGQEEPETSGRPPPRVRVDRLGPSISTTLPAAGVRRRPFWPASFR